MMHELCLVIEPDSKVLLFPVETIVRELDYRLVLAARLVRPGVALLLGNHTDIYELGRRMRGAVYVGKHILNLKPDCVTERYEAMKECGHRVVFLHEEGAIFSGDRTAWERGLLRKFDPHWMRAEDTICVWGNAQAEVYRRIAPEMAGSIRTTGHPRFDLCKDRYRPLYAAESDALRREFGRFLLVNTNFTLSNSMQGWDWCMKRDSIDPADSTARTRALDYFGYDLRRVTYYVQLISRLSDAFPDRQILLRPHPSERMEIYETLLRHVPRVHLRKSGSLVAWLHAAEALIHTDCTTALEAYAARTPIIHYRPENDPRFLCADAAGFGTQCRSVEEVIAATKRVLAGEHDCTVDPQALAETESVIHNLSPDRDGLSLLAEAVNDALESAGAATKITGSLLPFELKGRRLRAKSWMRQKFPVLRKRGASRNAHAREKFPGLDAAVIQSKLDIIQQIEGHRLVMDYISPALIAIRAA
jgi:surface carbohydrate biosynthesis protein